MTTVELINDDCRIAMRDLISRGVQVHSVVCDPPYGLVSIIKRFGNEGSVPAKYGSDGAFARTGAGFMGSKWDGTGIENDPEMWKLCFDLLLPGGYLLAFSSPRTGHRMACAIEDAGFIIHPFIGWANGQGMPKDHDAAKAIDRQLGTPGETVPNGDPVRRMRPGADQTRSGDWEKLDDRVYQPGEYVPGSPEAAEWLGWSYGGQARKPVLEPIYVAQKPFSEKNGALNMLKHGVGAVNIDGCRAGGRHPANLIHDGSPEVVAQFPKEAGASAPVKGTEPSDVTNGIYGKFNARVPGTFYADTGSAARFFECYPFDDQTVFYHSKASTKDRVLTCLECGNRTIGKRTCNCTTAEGKTAKTRSHPTVKAIGLMRALVRHVTPIGGTVLDPFAGSGTTGYAARQEGMNAILIEAEPEYAKDIRCRLDLPSPLDTMFDDLLGESECRYCANTGWFYGTEELGPCGCSHGDKYCEAVPAYSTKSGLETQFEDLLG